MNDRITGFVLSQSDYRENDILMQVLTKEHGILSLVGKAAKKLSSRNHFLPMCLYEFIIDYKDSRTIYSVHGYKLLENHFEDSDIEMMAFKDIICEMALKNREIDTFDQLCFVFRNMDRESRFLLGSLFLSCIIKRFGIMPIVDSCALCDSRKVVALSNRHGGFLCQAHLNGEEVLPVETLRKFRAVIKADFANYDVLKQFDYEYREVV